MTRSWTNALKRIGVAYRCEGDWQARLRAGFAAYAAEVVEEPKAARLVLVEVLGAGPAALERMRRTRLIFEQVIGASFSEAPDGVTLPPLIVKAIVCGMERITRQRLLADDVEALPALADELLAVGALLPLSRGGRAGHRPDRAIQWSFALLPPGSGRERLGAPAALCG